MRDISSTRTFVLIIAACLLGTVPACRGCVALEPDGPVGKPITKAGVRLYIRQKRLEMDGAFVCDEGPINLVACAKEEANARPLIALEADPEIAYFCLLLMGVRPEGTTGGGCSGSVIIKVSWRTMFGRKTVRAEDLCWDVGAERPMKRSVWMLARTQENETPAGAKMYWATVSRSIIGVRRDIESMIHPRRTDGVTDKTYTVNKRLAPKAGAKCTVILEAVRSHERTR